MALMKMAKFSTKNLFRRPVTERYPFVPKHYPKGARGKVDIEVEKCIFCGICQRKCPTSAIMVDKPGKSWEIDRLRCISCNYCVEVCPKKCLALDTNYSKCSRVRYKDKFTAPEAPVGPAGAAAPAAD